MRRSSRQLSILDVMQDRELFAGWFKKNTWGAWRSFLAALFGLPMNEAELAIYRQCSGRATAPTLPAREGWLIVGRRGGKSFIVALIAVFLACLRDYSKHLAPGERGVVLIAATDRKQARVIFRYVRALLENVPMLAKLVERMDNESIDLSSRISLEIQTASYRTVRGYTVVAFIGDEIAFWRSDDSANPDREILDAVRPAMATIPGALLLGISSPYARRGVLYEAHQRYYGRDGDILVWQADTRTMNPTVPQRIIDEAMERDPATAAAEYLAQFRTDVESFIAREAVQAVVEVGCFERAPQPGTQYCAFTDPSGGSSDSFTLAVTHREDDIAVLDAVREWQPPFSPESVTAEAAQLLKSYRLSEATGDNYAGLWPRESFARHGISYRVSDKTRSEIYLELLPAINSGRVRLLDNERLMNQLVTLERRTARSGKDSVDHAPGGHDDVSNSVAGALVLASGSRPPALLQYYGNLLATAPADPVLSVNAGSQREKRLEDLDPREVYAATYAGTLATLLRGEKCSKCGGDIQGSRVTDGYQSWHVCCL